MTEPNPYASPKVSPGTALPHRSVPFDVGIFVGWYLRVLACLSVASMAVNLVFFSRLQIDLSFPFLLWAGSCLVRHSPTARKWVIGISGFFLVILVFVSAMSVFAVVAGTEGMSVRMMGRQIDNPSVWHVLAVASLVGLLPGIPFVLLLTRQARREFACTSGQANTILQE